MPPMPVLSLCSLMPQPSSVIEMAKLEEEEEESSMAIRSRLAQASLALSVKSPKAESGTWCACALASKKVAPVLKEGAPASSSSIVSAGLLPPPPALGTRSARSWHRWGEVRADNWGTEKQRCNLCAPRLPSIVLVDCRG